MPRSTVKDKDDTGKLLARIREATTRRIRVGIVGKRESFFAMLAAVHEFGTDRAGRNHNIVIPERSFIRSTFDSRRVTNRVIDKSRAVFDLNIKVGGILNGMGLLMAAAIRRKVRSNIPPRIKDATAKRKGSGRSLVHTGAMVNRIQHEVVK